MKAIIKSDIEIDSQIEHFCQSEWISAEEQEILRSIPWNDFNCPENIMNPEVSALVEKYKTKYIEFLKDQVWLSQNFESLRLQLNPLLEELVKLENIGEIIELDNKIDKENDILSNLLSEVFSTRWNIGYAVTENMEQEVRDLVARKLTTYLSKEDGEWKTTKIITALSLTNSEIAINFLLENILNKTKTLNYIIKEHYFYAIFKLSEESIVLRTKLIQLVEKLYLKNDFFSKEKLEYIFTILMGIHFTQSELQLLYWIYKKTENLYFKWEFSQIFWNNDFKEALKDIELSLSLKYKSDDYISGADWEIRAVWKMWNKDSISLLMPYLDNPSYIQTTIDSLGKIGDSRVVPKLLELLLDESIGYKESIIQALGNIGDESATEPLFNFLLNRSNNSLWWYISNALVKIWKPIELKRILPILKIIPFYDLELFINFSINNETDIFMLAELLENLPYFRYIILSRIKNVGKVEDVIKLLQAKEFNEYLIEKIIDKLESDYNEEVKLFFEETILGNNNFSTGLRNSYNSHKIISKIAIIILEKKEVNFLLDNYSYLSNIWNLNKTFSEHFEEFIPLFEENKKYHKVAKILVKYAPSTEKTNKYLLNWVKNYWNNRDLWEIALTYFTKNKDIENKVNSFLYKLLRDYWSWDAWLREKAVFVFIFQWDKKAVNVLRPMYPEYIEYYKNIYDNSWQCHEPLEKYLKDNFVSVPAVEAILFQEKEKWIPIVIQAWHIDIIARYEDEINDKDIKKIVWELKELYEISGYKIIQITRDLNLNLYEKEDRDFVLKIAKKYQKRSVWIFNWIIDCQKAWVLNNENRKEIIPFQEWLNMITPILFKAYLEARNKDLFFEEIHRILENIIYDRTQDNSYELSQVEKYWITEKDLFELIYPKRNYSPKNIDLYVDKSEHLKWYKFNKDWYRFTINNLLWYKLIEGQEMDIDLLERFKIHVNNISRLSKDENQLRQEIEKLSKKYDINLEWKTIESQIMEYLLKKQSKHELDIDDFDLILWYQLMWKYEDFNRDSNDKLANFSDMETQHMIQILALLGEYWDALKDTIKTLERKALESVDREYFAEYIRKVPKEVKDLTKDRIINALIKSFAKRPKQTITWDVIAKSIFDKLKSVLQSTDIEQGEIEDFVKSFNEVDFMFWDDLELQKSFISKWTTKVEEYFWKADNIWLNIRQIAKVQDSIYNELQKESNKFESLTDEWWTDKDRNVFARFWKTKWDACARWVWDICIWIDEEMWEENEDYFELVLFDEERKKNIWTVMLLNIQEENWNKYLLYWPNPSVEFVDKVPSQLLYKKISELVTSFASENNYDWIVFNPVHWRSTNRSWDFQKALEDSQMKDWEWNIIKIDLEREYILWWGYKYQKWLSFLWRK